jgi:hypothetical protein
VRELDDIVWMLRVMAVLHKLKLEDDDDAIEVGLI